jgi:peptidoglycan/xylan/chitin deacetylase (PgdA/CDA1 family)
MYHYVRDPGATRFPGIRALPPALFEQQLDWLEAHHTLVTPERFQDAVDGRAPLPPNAALLTFDDGFIDHYETVFPILRARGLSGIFFASYVASGPRPMLLGVHKTHCLLGALGPETFGRAVLEECRMSLSRDAAHAGVFGRDPWEDVGERAIKHLLNYELPYGDADRVLDDLFARHIGDAAVIARAFYLDEQMMAEMARGGMVFGYHTRTHRMLSRLSTDEQEAELRDGAAWIRAITGQVHVPFCYPWGGRGTYTAETIRILRDTGYALAFNTVRRRKWKVRSGKSVGSRSGPAEAGLYDRTYVVSGFSRTTSVSCP